MMILGNLRIFPLASLGSPPVPAIVANEGYRDFVTKHVPFEDVFPVDGDRL